MKNLLISGMLLFTSLTFAGDKGNGGDARIIDGKYYSLDLVEAANHLNPYIDPNSPYSKEIDKEVDSYFGQKEFDDLRPLIKSKLGELEKIDMVSAHSILLAAKNYIWTFIYDQDLTQVYDEFSVLEGDSIQVGIRRNTSILVDALIFEKLNRENKVAFIFHELISALAKDKSLVIENTRARELTGALFNYELMTTRADLLKAVLCRTIPCVGINNENPEVLYRNKGMSDISIYGRQSTLSTLSIQFDGYDLTINTIRDLKSLENNLCETLWKDKVSERQYYEGKALNPHSYYSFYAYDIKVLLGFFDHDYTYKSLKAGVIYSDEIKKISTSKIIYGKITSETKQECVKEKRNGKCKEWQEKQVKVFKMDKDIFDKSCADFFKADESGIQKIKESLILSPHL